MVGTRLVFAVWLCDQTDHSPLGSSVHGVFRARMLQQVSMPSSPGSSRPRDYIAGGFFTAESPEKLGTHLSCSQLQRIEWGFSKVSSCPHPWNLGTWPCSGKVFADAIKLKILRLEGHPQSNSSAQSLSRVRLRDLVDDSTPGLPIHHQLPELAQTHVYRVGDAIQPSHPLLSPSAPAFNLSQHQGLFQWVSSLHQVAKVSGLQLQYQFFQWLLLLLLYILPLHVIIT